ncbi:MAG: Lon-like protease [Frankiaceae bacterium]|jgi:PDZ domain-containing protein|nr:Lon-like protease [Frankiaceae bacterium]
MSRRGITLLTAAALALVLGVLAAVLPVPYVILVPGPPTDTLGAVPGGTAPVIKVDGAQSYDTGGHLYLTTVGVQPGPCDAHPSLWEAMRAWFDPHDAVEPHQVICPPDQSSQSVQAQNADEMSQSQRDAMTAALLYLGYKPVTREVILASVSPSAPSAKVLQARDVVVAVDGKPVHSPDELRALVSAATVGGPITVAVKRGGKTLVLHTTVTSDPTTHRPLLGVQLDQNATFAKVHVKIGIDPNDVGGPSAGLMFTLGIIDKLTPGGLTGGKTIAGTGTIDGFGQVGPIGGIQQKIAAITGYGPAGMPPVHASYFLAPASECADAKAAAPSSLVVIRVDTLATAVAALKSIEAGRTDYPRC